MKRAKERRPPEAARGAEEAAALIRRVSEEGRLVSEAEILAALGGSGPESGKSGAPAGDKAADVKALFDALLAENEDLCQVRAESGERLFYSSLSMSCAYAAMLLCARGDPARLIAEIVRHDSEAYPRPVPLDLFFLPPFDLSPDEAAQTLAKMKALPEYADIEETSTSTARLFLYSTQHLEPAHASMLAEWLDVGRRNNP